ncbi:helix-turn-helix domain-containing protein [Vibrio campbellii]
MPIEVEFHFGSQKVISSHANLQHCSSSPYQVVLTRSEFLILSFLSRNLCQHFSKEQLIRQGWPDSYVGANSLNMAIMSLRKKLLKLGGFWEISTIQRFGYSLNPSLEYLKESVDITYYSLPQVTKDVSLRDT